MVRNIPRITRKLKILTGLIHCMIIIKNGTGHIRQRYRRGKKSQRMMKGKRTIDRRIAMIFHLEEIFSEASVIGDILSLYQIGVKLPFPDYYRPLKIITIDQSPSGTPPRLLHVANILTVRDFRTF